MLFYAEYIAIESAKLKFNKGDVLSTRLKGIHYEMKNDYAKAIEYYFLSLDAARKLPEKPYTTSALSDLAILYSGMKRPDMARKMYLQILRETDDKDDIVSITSTYSNLGAIYSQLKMNDSALYYLYKGLSIAQPHKGKLDLSTLYNNIGNVYFDKNEFPRAMGYFRENMKYHLAENEMADLWTDYLNIGDAYTELKKFDSAQIYADKALTLSRELNSRHKEASSYSILSKLYHRKGDYRKAFDYQQQWYRLDTALVNVETNQSVAELQERFDVKERESENQLLQSKVEKQRIQNKSLAYLAIASVVIGLLIAGFLVQKRRSHKRLEQVNNIISRQNDKLAELNYEKNSLISVVSHDLSTPFAGIKTWGQVLQSDQENLSPDQQKAIDRIMQSATRGETLIRSILDVEKAETNQRKIKLENFDLSLFAEEILDDFKPGARKKNISLHYGDAKKEVFIISDKNLVSRVFENLLSNAVKYTAEGKNIWLSVSEENDAVHIQVKDEGIGIPKDELKHLFSKYSQLSSAPTNGEKSTGLGLSIVKRIVDELNGNVYCESESGKGSMFTVVLKK